MAHLSYVLSGRFGLNATTRQPAARSLESTICFRVRYSDLLGEGLGIVGARLDFRRRIKLMNRCSAYDTPNWGSNRKVKASIARPCFAGPRLFANQRSPVHHRLRTASRVD
jgi:hypothetical protein